MKKDWYLLRKRVKYGVLAHVSSCRGRILGIVEAQIGDTKRWPIVRGQLLSAFGERGLSGDVRRVVAHAFGGRREQ